MLSWPAMTPPIVYSRGRSIYSCRENQKDCISKIAQARLVEMIAEQYGHGGLAVAVHPGAVKTGMAEGRRRVPRSFFRVSSSSTATFMLRVLIMIQTSSTAQSFTGHSVTGYALVEIVMHR